jgi:protein-tyrosine phosphatase
MSDAPAGAWESCLVGDRGKVFVVRARRTLDVDGLVAGWDMGGVELLTGATTPFGVFFRSGTVDRLSPRGWEELRDVGVRTVVDLRRADEIDTSTSRPNWMTTVSADLDGFDNEEFWKEYLDSGRFGTALYYLPHLRAMPERATEALTAIVSAPPGGVLFHCMGGRDRTGLISMLLLTAAGATIDGMTADYMQVARRVEALAAARQTARGEITIEEVCREYGTTTEGAFRQAARNLNLDAVLDAGGMASEVRASLRSWRGTL